MPTFDLTGPLCWAHRGYSARCPENTLPAFRAALDAGVHGVELDVNLSRDGELVVIHDETLDRTTSGAGPVAALTLAELKGLDAGSWFGPDFAGVRLPTLEEALDVLGGKLLVNIEIKPEARRAGADVERRVLETLAARGLKDSVIISSFDYMALIRLRGLDEDIRLGLLLEGTEDNVDYRALASAVEAFSLHTRADVLCPEVVDIFHDDGRGVFCWAHGGRDEGAAMDHALACGADGFFANDVELFLRKVG
ncbi:glycerophosphodiester phosphodiesterase [Desulfocurvus sp. DL9XJH121]